MIAPLAAIDSGWAAAIGSLLLASGGLLGLLLEQRRRRRSDKKADRKAEAEAPSLELNATSKAAEAIARAAASLISPFQETIAGLTRECGALREAITTSRSAEEKCQRDLAECRAELASVKTKVQEITNHLELDGPDGES